MVNLLVRNVLIYAFPVLFAITLHEVAHGYVARLRGDNTAYVLGRLTLNPLRHIDPLGTLILPAVLYFATGGAFVFGYAKPVPIDVGSLRNPRWDMLWVALAGPTCNFVQALVWALFSVWLNASGGPGLLMQMASAGITVNLVLAALNLFPLPPLDGGRVLAAILPTRQSYAFSRVEGYGFFIVMFLVISGVLSAYWLRPLMWLGFAAIRVLLSPLS